MSRTVIVGAGSAGAVIAARMTESEDHEVVLVEAGPDYPGPAWPSDLTDGSRNSMTSHDWGLSHRPVPGQFRIGFPRGRVVGGSSSVNTCIALRGQPYDYDEWGSLGLDDWSWDLCLPAFKRLENDLDFVNEWHSQGGPIPIRRHTREELVPWQSAFLGQCEELGYPRCEDTNDPTTTGYGPHAMNKVRGERVGAARGYLTAGVRARKNLRIVTHTIARRVVLRGLRAVGVEVESHGRVHTIFADRVVLSAGAIATPGVLLRSGIGPRDVVERLGVTSVHDLPAVGARLLDHPGCALFLRPKRGVVQFDGPLVQTVCRYTSKGSDCPNDIQLQPGSFVPLPRFNVPLVTVACCIGKPRGHGKLVFPSANAHDKPRIDSGFLLDAKDREMAVEAIGFALRIATGKVMSELATPLWPSRKTLENPAKRALVISKICGSGYHPCGTVPMGKEGAPGAATDGRGRVRGVEGLLVADASLMPTIPSSNTNLPTLMIGERFGAWLRDRQI